MATVSKGTITAVGVGDATITATAINGVSDSIEVRVLASTVLVDRDKLTVKVGEAENLRAKIVGEVGAREFFTDEGIAKVSIVGTGMKSNPGVAARMFGALADADINISLISTSSIRTSVVVKVDQAQQAVRCLHTAFGLDSNSTFEETQLSGEELAKKAAKGR